MKSVIEKYSNACRKVALFAHRHGTALMLVLGLLLLVGGLSHVSSAQDGNFKTFSEANYEDSLVRNAVGNLFKLIEGAFGALIMVVAGLGAIVAAAMGAYRAAVGMLVVAVGAFILRALVSLFFGTAYVDYETGAAG